MNKLLLYQLMKSNGIPKNGLIGYWRLLPADTEQLALDYSLRQNHLQYGSLVGADTNDPTKNADGSLTFGGDDYLRQRALANKTGTVTASMVSGTAFINDSGQTFDSYVRSNSTSRYLIVLVDSAGKKAWGYIGEQGTGETLSNNLFTSWNNIAGAAFETFITDGILITSAINTSGYGNASVNYLLITGKLYKYSNTFVLNSGTNPGFGIYDNGFNSGVQLVKNSEGYVCSQGVYVYNKMGLITTNGQATNFSIPAISFSQVLTPSTNGVKIYSTKTGTTQNWSSMESGFNANSISSYEIRSSDFNITGALTLIYIFKPNGADEEGYVVSKFTGGNGYAATISAANVIDFSYGNGAGGYQQVSSDAVFDEDGTYARAYIAVGADLSVDFYKNGSFVNTETLLNAIDDAISLFTIGTREGSLVAGSTFTGDIALVAVYNRKLSATEIASIDRNIVRDLTIRGIL